MLCAPPRMGWVGRDLEGAVVSIHPLDLLLVSDPSGGSGQEGFRALRLCVCRSSVQHQPRGGMWV